MIAVIFELWPRAGETERYFDIAAGLRDSLEKIDGFISVERFESVSQPGKFLSLSIWRDEAALRTWRTEAAHRRAQQLGREEIFDNYRLRVASIMRDYGIREREEAPLDSKQALPDLSPTRRAYNGQR